MSKSPASQAKAVCILDRKELEACLSQLRRCLEELPRGLPDNMYNFQHFEPSEEDVDKYGRQGALNHALEVTFCPGGRQQGPFSLAGRGPGLLAVVDVLSKYTAEFPQDAMLQKWVLDLTEAAQHACGNQG